MEKKDDMKEIIAGYVNIFKNDGMLQMGLGIYEKETIAVEVGHITKGYITTIPIYFDIPIEEEKKND